MDTDERAATARDDRRRCSLCGRLRDPSNVVAGDVLRPTLVELIRRDHPEWSADSADSWVCLDDLHRYRMEHLRDLLDADEAGLTPAEEHVLDTMATAEPISTDPTDRYEERLTFGQRVADRLSSFGGSWTFIGLFGGFILVWMVGNTYLLLGRPFDPYPFILLNLVLSCLAALQAPVIMMSQNRQEAKDRLRAEHDYEVNLKAELEIRQLQEKLDYLLQAQWHRLLERQELQAELIDELQTRERESGGGDGDAGRSADGDRLDG